MDNLAIVERYLRSCDKINIDPFVLRCGVKLPSLSQAECEIVAESTRHPADEIYRLCGDNPAFRLT